MNLKYDILNSSEVAYPSPNSVSRKNLTKLGYILVILLYYLTSYIHVFVVNIDLSNFDFYFLESSYNYFNCFFYLSFISSFLNPFSIINASNSELLFMYTLDPFYEVIYEFFMLLLKD